MVNNEVKLLINEVIALYSTSPITQGIIDKGCEQLSKAITLLKGEDEKPFIVINYYNPKFESNNDVIIPFYATDFFQKEYINNDYSEEFVLRYEIDGEVFYKNIKAGDNEVNLGKLECGFHWYSLQITDRKKRNSRRIFNEIWVIDESYHITLEQTYSITDNDLLEFKVNKNNSSILEDMVNNRMGLTALFKKIQENGYRKAILPTGIYRINRAKRLGANEETPIEIPTNFTLDMNGSTFKLHPFNDTEYGKIGQVENCMVRMKECFDSHIINGVFEGDYFERKEKGWTSGYNGEASNCFMSYGGDYNSLENVEIKQVTGYNSSVNQSGNLGSSKVGEWQENLKIINGVDTLKKGFVTSQISPLSDTMINNKYITVGVYLGYGGLKGSYWDIEYHFYDINKNFIETIPSYQYTRCRIPKEARYFRVTLKGSKSEMNGLTAFHMNVERNFEYNNCHWVDNRTCSNPNHFQHLIYNNCTFTRSGESITACEIDVEDGWEQSQDMFLIGCEIKERIGAGDLIDNCGINHQMIGCKNFNFTARYRLRGITMKNNDNCGFSLNVGFMTGNTVRCFENSMEHLRYGDTGEYQGKEKNVYKIINCDIIEQISNTTSNVIIDNCRARIGGSNHNIVNSLLTRGDIDYIHEGIYQSNCIYDKPQNADFLKFSFNKYNVKRVYKNNLYLSPCQFVGHNAFNSGQWNDCVFKDTVLIFPNKNMSAINKMGDIQFNNCIFEKDVTIDSSFAYIQFNQCTFLGSVNYKNKAKELTEFN